MEVSSRLREVSAEIRAVVDEVDLPAQFADAIVESLALSGGILAAEPLVRWWRLVLAAAESAGLADWRQALPAAAAFELTVASFQILDDIQDGDPNPTVGKLGLPQALNVVVGLLLLGQRALLRLPARGVAPELALDVQRELSTAIARVGGGQFLDLALEGNPSATEQEALDIAGRKTASLVASACRVGGRLGTADPRVLAVLERFGWSLGLADQLGNELEALDPARGKGDLVRGKATLPAAAARVFDLSAESVAETDVARQKALADEGGLYYTWVVMDSHRQQAREVLHELGQGYPTEALLDLL